MIALKKFRVQGWRKASPAASKREPMKPMVITAKTGEMAAATYARCNTIPRHFWNDGSFSPLIVIRVEPA